VGVEVKWEHHAANVAALAARARAGVSATAGPRAAGEGVAVLVDAAVPTRTDADVAAASRVHATIKSLAMGAGVAGDGHIRSARSAFSHRILVAITVSAALAPGGRASIATACARSTTLELVVEVVCTANRTRGHARMAATFHADRAVCGPAIVRAGLEDTPRDHILDDRVGLKLLVRIILRLRDHLVDLLVQGGSGRTDGLSGYGVLLTVVLAADASLACAGITTAGAASTACEAVGSGVFVVAADATIADTHITTAGRVDPTGKIHAVGVGARLKLLVIARGVLRNGIQISFMGGAAFAAVRGTSVSTALTVLVALKIDSIIIDATLGVHRHADTAAAFVVVIANEVDPAVVANVQPGLRHEPIGLEQ